MGSPAEVGPWEVAPSETGPWSAAALPFHGSDAADWWFRARFESAAGDVLRLGGLATVCEVWLDGEPVLSSDSMFHRHELGVPAAGAHEIVVCARALEPLLRERRRPRARWRSRIGYDGNLRWIRTSLLGRAPGFAPGPPVVGPWRPATVGPADRLAGLRLRPRVEGSEGVLVVSGAAAADRLELAGPSGSFATVVRDGAAELRIPEVDRWWPHTSGDPVLHEVRLFAGEALLATRRVGFRTLEGGSPDEVTDGLELRVNGVPVFARGVVWTPVPDAELRTTLEQLRDAGMTMLRVPGTGRYESPAFHDLCDELGLLVWQDFMFATFDYPAADPAFRASVEREAAELLAEVGGRPSLAVLGGNTEVEQQVAMLGLDLALARDELFDAVLPALVEAADVDAIYVPSSPYTGDLPLRADRGVTHYYGVGGYRRPVDEARRADVRFAAECLAFGNVPDEVEHLVHEPAWKAGVPRDAGAGWDFDDIRDHYLGERYGVDPTDLRAYDHERYLDLSRQVTGEVMAEVLGEWRRGGSRCAGAVILWSRDLVPGAGWGLVDHGGRPKAAYHHVRRALAGVAVWTTDEGLGGMRIHLANDGPEPVPATLRLALYRDGEHLVGEGEEALELPPHTTGERDAELLLGRFTDVSWTYRFGPPAQDVVVASLERDGALLSQAFRFPAGPPAGLDTADGLGLEAELRAAGAPSGAPVLAIRSRRLAYGVRVQVPGFLPADDAFSVEPGHERLVALRPLGDAAPPRGAALTAINLRGRLPVG
jgi:beta-mannosidase